MGKGKIPRRGVEHAAIKSVAECMMVALDAYCGDEERANPVYHLGLSFLLDLHYHGWQAMSQPGAEYITKHIRETKQAASGGGPDPPAWLNLSTDSEHEEMFYCPAYNWYFRRVTRNGGQTWFWATEHPVDFDRVRIAKIVGWEHLFLPLNPAMSAILILATKNGRLVEVSPLNEDGMVGGALSTYADTLTGKTYLLAPKLLSWASFECVAKKPGEEIVCRRVR